MRMRISIYETYSSAYTILEESRVLLTPYCFIMQHCVFLHVRLAIECKVKLFKYIQIFRKYKLQFKSPCSIRSIFAKYFGILISIYAMKCSMRLAYIFLCYTCSQKDMFVNTCVWEMCTIDTMNEFRKSEVHFFGLKYFVYLALVIEYFFYLNVSTSICVQGP